MQELIERKMIHFKCVCGQWAHRFEDEEQHHIEFASKNVPLCSKCHELIKNE